MTEQGATASFANSHLNCRHTSASSRRIPPELCLNSSPSSNRGRREGRVPAGTHGPLCACSAMRNAQRHTGEAEHTAFPAQWSDGLCRALPGAEFLLASLALRKSPAPRRLTRMPHPQRLDRSDDGRDHTVLPYASVPAPPRGFAGHQAPFVQRGLQVAHGARLNPLPRPALTSATALPRPPQPGPRFERLANRPSSTGRAVSTYAAIPNFGKVEYFCEEGLTGGGVFCPTGHGP